MVTPQKPDTHTPSECMVDHESLRVIKERTRTLMNNVEAIYEAIFGNGQDGIKARMLVIEEKQKSTQKWLYILMVVLALLHGAEGLIPHLKTLFL